MDPIDNKALSSSPTDVIVTVIPELLTSIPKFPSSKVENVNELVVLRDTGFKIPPIEKLTKPPAARLLPPKPPEMVILLPDIAHVIAVLNPEIEAQEVSATVLFGILT